jgi:hypothetical protein
VDDVVRKKEAVSILAKIVHPQIASAHAEKRIRAAIQYAINTGELSVKASDREYPAPDFFDWARGKWSQHSDAMRDLPSKPVAASMAAREGGGDGMNAFAVAVPREPDELARGYVEAESARRHAEKALEDTRRRLAESTEELNTWREKDRTSRRRKSEAGKRGGRPRKGD